MLEIGEIKAPEFMYLLKGLSVFGIENQAEYDIRPTDSKKTNEAINYYLNKSIRIDADDRSWTLETAKIISNYRDPQQEVSRLRELKEKVERAGNVDAGIKSFYDDYLKFEDAAIKRSATMAAGVKTALEKNNGIMAMVIGDAHTRDIAEQFRKDRVNYYIARPFGLDERSVDRSSVDFKRKGEGKPVYGNDAYEKFLAGSLNTRSPFFLGWFENRLSASVLVYRALLLANASKSPAALAVPAGDRVRGAVRLDSYRRLDDGSLIMEIRNGGQRIFVRAAGGGGGAAEDIETPLAEMAVRLRDNPDSTWGQNIGDNILMVKQHDKTIVYSEDREPLEKVDIRKNVSIVQCLKDNGLMVSSEFIEYAVFLSARAGYQDLPAEKIVLMTIFRFNDPDIKERREQIEADLRKQYEEESRMRPGREDIWEKEIQLLFPLETKIRPGSRLPLAS
jgi:hypothetical protein